MAAQSTSTNPNAPAIAGALADTRPDTRSGSIALPELRAVAVESLDPADVPALRIKTDEDVRAWTLTRGYQDYGLFLRRLAESVVGRMLPHDVPTPDQVRIRIPPYPSPSPLRYRYIIRMN